MRSRGEVAAGCRAGADAVGFLVGQAHASRDFIAEDVAAALAAEVPSFVSRVLVTHLADATQVIRLCGAVPCDVLQWHTDIAAEDIAHIRSAIFPRRIIAKVSVDGREAIDRALSLAQVADAILLDSIDRAADQVGGTGKVNDWSISAEIVRSCPRPVILAGGLNPGNVAAAIRAVAPWGVDVNSGVKTQDGARSEALMRQFAEAVRNV